MYLFREKLFLKDTFFSEQDAESRVCLQACLAVPAGPALRLFCLATVLQSQDYGVCGFCVIVLTPAT